MFIRHHIKNTLYRAITGICASVLVLSCIAASGICAEDRNLFAISAKDLHTLQKPLADYDADQVVRYLGHAVQDISDPTIVKKITLESPAVKIPHDQDIRTGDFHFSRFMISHNFHKGKEINRRTVGGILLFEDQYCRTISMAFDTEYSVMPWGDITMYQADIRPINAPAMPVCKLFFVPAGNISQSILKTRDFTALLDHVVNNAVPVGNPRTITRTKRNYYVFAFFMDRLDKDATVNLVVSNTVEGSSGTSKHAAAFQDQGWHVTYTKAAFAFDGNRETFFKAVYTPGSSASSERRTQTVTRIFTSWVTKPSDYMIRQTQMGLARLGYDIKTVDGKAGKATHNAIRQFQKDIGVAADGKPDAELLALLEGYRELTGPPAAAQKHGNDPITYSGAALIKKIQTALSRLGYDPGPADGRTGTRTINAIRQFQDRSTLPVDGKPSNALLQKLEHAATMQLLKTRQWPNRLSRPEA